MEIIPMVEKIVAFLKKDPNYKIKVDYSVRQLLYILMYRGVQVVRGMLVKLSISAHGLVFCGRGVVIQHGYQIKAGPNLILEELVHINALSEQGISLGRNVTVAKGTIIVCTGVIANRGIGLTIGNNSAIGAQSFLGCQGGVRLGNNVIMGPGVRIFSENHNFDDVTIPIRLQGETRKGVVIHDDCWVGSGVTILDGVCIGEGSMVAAGSVVTKDIPPFSVVAGIPARILKNRKI
jgi:acetyltransferase-like isoleucine patch superfamily enzyme